MVVLWNSHTVKQSRWRFCLIQIKHYSTRDPIPLWLCGPHVHWCRDCETVPEQLETNQGLFHSLNAHRHNEKKGLELELRVKFKVNQAPNYQGS